jgi:hypothetical protein
MHAQKMGKFNLWLRFFFRVKYSNDIKMHLSQCIMKCLEWDFFPYAIVSFNFSEKHQKKHNLLHPLLFHIIHKCIEILWFMRRKKKRHDKCVTLHLIDLCVLISGNMFKDEILKFPFTLESVKNRCQDSLHN